MMELVNETGRRLKGIIPSVTGQLQQVDNVLKASLSDMGSVSSSDPQTASREVEKILEEANRAAEEAVRSRFPEFPSELTAELEQSKIPVALADGVGEVVDEGGVIKELVYDYVKKRKGHLSIAECASELGVTPKEVERTILQLRDEGKVTL